ncbi:hypothetical protein H1R20_g16429, partial [Candolleomyces eurysporus]
MLPRPGGADEGAEEAQKLRIQAVLQEICVQLQLLISDVEFSSIMRPHVDPEELNGPYPGLRKI